MHVLKNSKQNWQILDSFIQAPNTFFRADACPSLAINDCSDPITLTFETLRWNHLVSTLSKTIECHCFLAGAKNQNIRLCICKNSTLSSAIQDVRFKFDIREAVAACQLTLDQIVRLPWARRLHYPTFAMDTTSVDQIWLWNRGQSLCRCFFGSLCGHCCAFLFFHALFCVVDVLDSARCPSSWSTGIDKSGPRPCWVETLINCGKTAKLQSRKCEALRDGKHHNDVRDSALHGDLTNVSTIIFNTRLKWRDQNPPVKPTREKRQRLFCQRVRSTSLATNRSPFELPLNLLQIAETPPYWCLDAALSGNVCAHQHKLMKKLCVLAFWKKNNGTVLRTWRDSFANTCHEGTASNTKQTVDRDHTEEQDTSCLLNFFYNISDTISLRKCTHNHVLHNARTNCDHVAPSNLGRTTETQRKTWNCHVSFGLAATTKTYNNENSRSAQLQPKRNVAQSDRNIVDVVHQHACCTGPTPMQRRRSTTHCN